ncbi:MAG: hypothetical protein K8F91_18345 [Candidatus Obscuribacterales bacterium]|nr:hypothetical protein [Candidatus Obscuribacterales bacterium]
MSKDCCKPKTTTESAICKKCSHKGRSVQRVTPESLLLTEAQTRLGENQYYYCPSETCNVVYFSNEDDSYFQKSDLSVRVGQKEADDPVTVCYCFGHTQQSVCEEIRKTGKSTVEADITSKVKAGLCSCEKTNPQGSCCLGNVSKAVKAGFELYAEKSVAKAD